MFDTTSRLVAVRLQVQVELQGEVEVKSRNFQFT